MFYFCCEASIKSFQAKWSQPGDSPIKSALMKISHCEKQVFNISNKAQLLQLQISWFKFMEAMD